jgi:GTPase SAR1 family protein
MESWISDILLLCATVWLGLRSHELQKQKTSAEQQLERLREYGRGLQFFEYTYIDVVLFGPRESGKTSLVQLWSTPWTNITDMTATREWKQYEVTLHEYEPIQKHHPVFERDQKFVPTLRMRVHDFPGEDEYRVEAVRKIGQIESKAVLLLVFKVWCDDEGIIRHSDANGEYYSHIFMDELREHLKSVAGSVSKAIVVFHKADSLPAQWSEEEALDRLQAANRQALSSVRHMFSGKLDYILTSSHTNRGLIDLLGMIGRCGIASESEVIRFDERLKILREEAARDGVRQTA